jgi:hypothetical protein
MSNSDDLIAKKDVISAIKDVKIPNTPIKIYLQEAEKLQGTAEADKAILLESGLDPLFIDELPVCIGACREAQSMWNEQRHTLESVEKEWESKSDDAYDLHDTLLHDFFYAYQDDIRLLKRVRAIAEGNGDEDMIQDMNDIAVFGKKHPKELAEINFDMAQLDLAAATSDEMAKLLAASELVEDSDSASKLLRDQAYTLLKLSVDKIRGAGKYKFWKNPEKLKDYRSEYGSKN